MSDCIRLELDTEGDELLILERLDRGDLAVAIMDGDGNETRVRIQGAALNRWVTLMAGGVQ